MPTKKELEGRVAELEETLGAVCERLQDVLGDEEEEEEEEDED